MHNTQFKSRAEIGDIILFTGRSLICKIQQLITRSRFDHVAIILKITDDSILLLESTGAEGVSVVYWEDFEKNKWYELYQRIAYRPLYFNRTDNDIINLENMIKDVLGKEYKMNPFQILFGNNTNQAFKNEFKGNLLQKKQEELSIKEEQKKIDKNKNIYDQVNEDFEVNREKQTSNEIKIEEFKFKEIESSDNKSNENKHTIDKEINNKLNLKDKKGFFCSELVATAYICMDLLTSNIPACKYLPSSFSTDYILNLQRNAILGEEYVLNFD